MEKVKDIVIKAEALGKRYTIGHESQNERYLALRDVLMQNVRSFWNKTRDMVQGKPIIQGDTLEEVWALKDVSFEIRQGEVVGIIGHNGAGKSTLLKVLSRVTEPSEGRVSIRGRVASLLEVGTGFHPELTGRENIYLNGGILGMTRAEIKRKFDEIVAFAEVEKYLDTPVKRYSSGMYVRLAFAIAAHLDPEILMVDEVLAVGDLRFRKKCFGKMRDVASNSGRTVLFVSHDMSAIQNICVRGMVITQGKIAFMGSAGEAVRRYIEGEGTNSANVLMEWAPGNRSYPFCEIFKVDRFYVVDRDGQVANNRLYSSKTYQIMVEGELLQRDARLMFMVAFYSGDRSLLFATDVHDLGGVNFDEMAVGKIRLTIPLPTHLLMSTSYEIELLSCLHHVGWILPPDNESRLKFDFFCDDDLNPYTYENRLGVLAPRIRWTISNKKDDE